MNFVIVEERPDSPDAMALIAELDEHLQGYPYPQESRHAFSIEKLLREGVRFFVLRCDGQPAACGGVKLYSPDYGEVKRMYVRPAFRGKGYGKAVLDHLSAYCLSSEIDVLRLETGIYQVEAIGLYDRYGFSRRASFGEYREDPMSVYFEKKL